MAVSLTAGGRKKAGENAAKTLANFVENHVTGEEGTTSSIHPGFRPEPVQK
jgi:hypothetical protein